MDEETVVFSFHLKKRLHAELKKAAANKYAASMSKIINRGIELALKEITKG